MIIVLLKIMVIGVYYYGGARRENTVELNLDPVGPFSTKTEAELWISGLEKLLKKNERICSCECKTLDLLKPASPESLAELVDQKIPSPPGILF